MPVRQQSDRGATFDITSCRDLLQKLKREMSRIRSSRDRDELADFGFNFAITAWHMTDWVWADLKGAYSVKAALAKEAGIQTHEFEFEQFRNLMCEKSKELNYCRLIATTSKHVGVDRWPVDPENFTATGSASVRYSVPAGAPLARSPLAGSRGGKWVLKINVNGHRTRANEIFEKVLDFWTQFIDRNRIGPSG